MEPRTLDTESLLVLLDFANLVRIPRLKIGDAPHA
jgi:hypothetical protein